MLAEAFTTLVRDPGHWMFEIFLMVLVDGLLIGIGWRWFQRRWLPRHDQKEHQWNLTPEHQAVIDEFVQAGEAATARHGGTD